MSVIYNARVANKLQINIKTSLHIRILIKDPAMRE